MEDGDDAQMVPFPSPQYNSVVANVVVKYANTGGQLVTVGAQLVTIVTPVLVMVLTEVRVPIVSSSSEEGSVVSLPLDEEVQVAILTVSMTIVGVPIADSPASKVGIGSSGSAGETLLAAANDEGKAAEAPGCTSMRSGRAVLGGSEASGMRRVGGIVQLPGMVAVALLS